MNRFLITILLFVFGISLDVQSADKAKVLILSGKNNHDWEKTSPYLMKMFTQSGLFEVELTENPDTLNTKYLDGFDVIVSNWNSFPDKELRWPVETEKALLNFIQDGGGFVTFHGATTAFYEWPEFKYISTGAWIEGTLHGKQCAANVKIQNTNHPVTKGMADFSIFEELWVNAEQNPDFEVLARAKNENTIKEGIEDQAVVMVKEYGKGRIFHTTLGHDVRMMRNTGFQTLLLRGTEWAASGKVKQKLPQELQEKNSTAKDFSWVETDSSFTLLQGQQLLWKYNFNEKHGKPFFHPVFVGKNNLTCVSPDDHLWHIGQWFSWKYINGVNYWEYINGGYYSEGVTQIKNVALVTNLDFSAEIILDIVYHPINGENVLAEKRLIKVSAPETDGSISMNYLFEFEALIDSVDINRTPILGEENGKSWGGYAGLSIRFNQDFMDSNFISSWDDEKVNGQTGDWLYMGFTGLDGKNVGTQIIISPQSQRKGAAWYSVDTKDLPFYYFSPAYLYKKPMLLLKGEKLMLNYRINHISGETNKATLGQKFEKYKKELNQ